MHSLTEENYLKAIFHLSQEGVQRVYTSDLALKLGISPASVTDMLKKLHEKQWIEYEKSRGFLLTKTGTSLALQVIRKHRLWELFLVQHLHFKWDEVHEVAEQLEHIHSEKLIQRLDEVLGFPKFDPHGDPIPDQKGSMARRKIRALTEADLGKKYVLRKITDHSKEFLDFLSRKKLLIGGEIELLGKEDTDQSLEIRVQGYLFSISLITANKLMVEVIS